MSPGWSNLTPEEQEKLARIGVKSCLDALFLRKASPIAFDSYIGRERAGTIADALAAALTDDERKLLAQPPPPRPPLGGRLGSSTKAAAQPATGQDHLDRLLLELHRRTESSA